MVSRIANYPVVVPQGVNINLQGQELAVKGKLGELFRIVHSDVNIAEVDGKLQFAPANDSRQANAMAGTIRALVNNMVQGVSEGFVRKLVLVGVGYRAKIQDGMINLTVGFSHPVDFKLPSGVTAETPTPTEIVLQGIDKQQVCQVAANIRAIRPPEPYKGKGIRYENERIILKEGKKK